MSKIFAILGDIHANIDALNVVLDDCRAQGVTDFLCTGDVVGYNACPHECMEIVRALGEEQLSPSEYYELVNKASKAQRKRAAGKSTKKDKEELSW